jgi:hypothetical protein
MTTIDCETYRAGGTGAFNRRALEYDPRLRRVRDRVEREISRPLPTDSAARIAGFYPSDFSTYFHAKVGVRFTEWSRHVRICARGHRTPPAPRFAQSYNTARDDVARSRYRRIRPPFRVCRAEKPTRPDAGA